MDWEKIWKIISSVRRVYPKVWESIFPDPPIPSLSPSAILVKERARRWRKIWMWVSAACWLYTPFVVGLFHQFSRRWWLLDFAIPALLVCAVTFYLAFRFPTATIVFIRSVVEHCKSAQYLSHCFPRLGSSTESIY
jgi:hypothetical protein